MQKQQDALWLETLLRKFPRMKTEDKMAVVAYVEASVRDDPKIESKFTIVSGGRKTG